MAVFVIKALHFPGYAPGVPAVQRFGDVPTSHPFAAYIDEMATLGIAAGCGAGNYCPDAVVSREAMAVFIMRGSRRHQPARAGEPSGSPTCPRATRTTRTSSRWRREA